MGDLSASIAVPGLFNDNGQHYEYKDIKDEVTNNHNTMLIS